MQSNDDDCVASRTRAEKENKESLENPKTKSTTCVS